MIGIYKQTAKDVMTTHVDTLRPTDTIHNALLMMAENDLSAIPVIDADGECVGIITQRDIIAEVRDKDVEDNERTNEAQRHLLTFGAVLLDELTNERVEDMMSSKVIKVGVADPVKDIAETMLHHKIHHIPVVGEDNRLVGIVSTMDIVAAI